MRARWARQSQQNRPTIVSKAIRRQQKRVEWHTSPCKVTVDRKREEWLVQAQEMEQRLIRIKPYATRQQIEVIATAIESLYRRAR